ncbi:SEL1-like repeat protein [Citrobacter braakii]|nr:SEL1-like repeat protein [Citrobacter braakii]
MTTQINIENDPHLWDDFAFGTREGLVPAVKKIDDPAAAAQWYRLAANGGDVGAQYLLGSMYEAGLGVERDLRIARYWYDVAARNGDEAAPHKVRELDERLRAGEGR